MTVSLQQFTDVTLKHVNSRDITVCAIHEAYLYAYMAHILDRDRVTQKLTMTSNEVPIWIVSTIHKLNYNLCTHSS